MANSLDSSNFLDREHAVEVRQRPGRARGEQATLLRWSDLPGVELLRADFRNHAFVPHWHDGFMIATSARGAERVRHHHVEHVVGPGSLALLNPGELHDGEAYDPATGWDFRALYISADALFDRQQTSDAPHGLHFAQPVCMAETTWSFFLHTHRALESSTSQLERQCLLSTLSEHMLRQTFGFRPRRGGTLAASRSALDTVREYLDARWVSPVSLDELAAVAGLSRYHLLRSFRMRFGLPPHAYQNQLRVRHAKELLFQGAAITKAALESGFYDQAHLTNVLRRHTGVTPARLQQQELCA